MKSLFRGFAALVLMSIAFAASAKTMDLSKYASGEGWQQFSSALVADKMMAPGSDRFNTIGLSNVMYNALGEAEQATVSRVGFHSLNRLTNSLPTEMTVDEFQKRASTLELPDVKVVADAKASAQTPTTMVPAAAAPQVQTPSAPVVTAENVRKQLEELSKTVDGKYSGINRRVAELQAGLKKAALKSDIAKIVEETQTIVNLNARVTKVEKRVDAVELKQLEFDSSLTRLDGQQKKTAVDVAKLQTGQDSISKLWLWVYGLAAAVAVMIVLNFVVLGRKPTSQFR